MDRTPSFAYTVEGGQSVGGHNYFYTIENTGNIIRHRRSPLRAVQAAEGERIRVDSRGFARAKAGDADAGALQPVEPHRSRAAWNGQLFRLTFEELFQLPGVFQVEGAGDQPPEALSIGRQVGVVHLRHNRRQELTMRARDAATDDHQAIEQCDDLRDRIAGHFTHSPESLLGRLAMALGASLGDFVDRLRLRRVVEAQPRLVRVHPPNSADGCALFCIDIALQLVAHEPYLAGHRVVAGQQSTIAHDAAA